MANLKKEVKEVVAEAQRQGWRAVEKKNGWMLLAPDGEHSEMLHKTPSDHRSIRNTVSRMRRYGGFKWKGK